MYFVRNRHILLLHINAKLYTISQNDCHTYTVGIFYFLKHRQWKFIWAVQHVKKCESFIKMKSNKKDRWDSGKPRPPA